jgi:hypothetical protein
MNRIFFILIMFVSINGLLAKEPVLVKDSAMIQLESKLKFFSDSLRYSKYEEVRVSSNDSFKKYLDTFLYKEGAFDIDLESINTVMIMRSPDRRLRIFTWLISDNIGNYKSYGAIQVQDKKGIRNYWLKEKSDYNKKTIEDEELTQDNWLGGLIYQIYEFKYKGDTRYCILTFHGMGVKVNRKSIDVISIEDDEIVFGLPVFHKFKDDYEPARRILFYFADEATMTLRFEPSKKQIVFDNLVPALYTVRGVDEYYLPDGTYSSFQLKSKGRWYMMEDFGDYIFER